MTPFTGLSLISVQTRREGEGEWKNGRMVPFTGLSLISVQSRREGEEWKNGRMAPFTGLPLISVQTRREGEEKWKNGRSGAIYWLVFDFCTDETRGK
uniref:Uncharacterized protein n=1 Tax=Nelumbo nucifera TaxID=4432 RepID=A0A822ZGR9_NELNU|nr:TPA_asm: hypothetical protein HUJ06_000899 [Nelumbo nucifera]